MRASGLLKPKALRVTSRNALDSRWVRVAVIGQTGSQTVRARAQAQLRPSRAQRRGGKRHAPMNTPGVQE